MTTFNTKMKTNIKILTELKKEDIINANRGILFNQGEYVQVDNIIELEYAIYFTFSQLMMNTNKYFDTYDELIYKIDDMIDNVYENKYLNNLMENDKEFHKTMYGIEGMYEDIKCNVFYYSPFYNFFKFIDDTYSSIYNTFKENNEFVTKLLKTYNKEIHCEGLYSSSDEEEDKEEEDKEEEDKEEEPSIINYLSETFKAWKETTEIDKEDEDEDDDDEDEDDDDEDEDDDDEEEEYRNKLIRR